MAFCIVKRQFGFEFTLIIYRRDFVLKQQVRRRFDIFNWSSSVFLLQNQIPRATNEKQYGDKQTHLDSNQFSNANNEKPYGENLLLLLLLLIHKRKKKNYASVSEA